MMNPLSDFFKAKDGSRLSEEAARTVKTGFYWRDYGNVKALRANGRRITLGEKGAKLNNVDFVAGLWRVQTKFPYKITRVRDKDLILTEKIQYKEESTNFEYWYAKRFDYNCYGPFIINISKPDFVVAGCVTDKGIRWGYGPEIKDARAYLASKLWAEGDKVEKDKYFEIMREAVLNMVER